MKLKTSELIDEKLDWAVSIALGHRPEKDFHSHGMTWNGWWETAPYIYTKPNEYRRLPKYSTDWSKSGPIIGREGISTFKYNKLNSSESDKWGAHKTVPRKAMDGVEYSAALCLDGPTPLISAMRCYVASKLGDVVEIPEELQ